MPVDDYTSLFVNWGDLPEKDKEFFVGENYLPLPDTHAEHISVLKGAAARSLIREALYELPGYSSAGTSRFTHEEWIPLEDVWGSEEKIQEVREWLHLRGIPYATKVLLLYDDIVVATDWKIIVRYWDAFAWSVGMEMLVVDGTKTWVCSFHHENVITFRKYSESHTRNGRGIAA